MPSTHTLVAAAQDTPPSISPSYSCCLRTPPPCPPCLHTAARLCVRSSTQHRGARRCSVQHAQHPSTRCCFHATQGVAAHTVAACSVAARGVTECSPAQSSCGVPTWCPSSPAARRLPPCQYRHPSPPPAAPLADNEGKSALSGEPLCCLYKGVWLLTHVR